MNMDFKLCWQKMRLAGIALFLFCVQSNGQSKVDTSAINVLIKSSRAFLNENKLKEALTEISKAESFVTSDKTNSILLKIYLNKASIQNVANAHYDAISTGLKGLQLAKEKKDKYYQTAFYRSLANNYDMLDNYEEAIPYYEKCLSSSEGFASTKLIRGHCFVEIGDAYRLYYKNPQKAKEFIEEGIKIYIENDSVSLGYALDYLGQAFTDLGLYQEAEKSFSDSRTIYEKNEEYYLIPELLFHTAELYRVQIKYDKAIQLANECVTYSQKYSSLYAESEAHKILYEVYKVQGHWNKALFQLEAYKAQRDEFTKSNIDNQFKQIKDEIQLEKQENRINHLLLEKSSNELKSQRLLLLGLGFLLLLTLFSIYYFNRLNKRLKTKNLRISEALLSGQETERQRLAIDLHDTLGSSLSSINWTLETVNSDNFDSAQKTVFENLKTQIAGTYKRISLLAQNLIPEQLEKQGLVAALKSLVRKNNESLRVNYRLEIAENFPRLSSNIEFQIYQICLEMMQIINKDKETKQAEISLENTNKTLLLVFSHDGNPEKTMNKSNAVFRNISLRVESMRGRIKTSLDKNQITAEIVFRV
jgi:signal transduction histidine kinase